MRRNDNYVSTRGRMPIDSNIIHLLKFQADLYIDESKIIWGKDKKSIYFRIKNKGAVYSKSFNIDIGCKSSRNNNIISFPSIFTKPSSELLTTIRIPSLRRGETKEIIHNLVDENILNTPSYFSFIDGIYELYFKVDSANEIKESDESNNNLTLIKYKISVKTSNAYGSDTDANVSIKLYGEDAESKFIDISNKNDNFEKGQLDTFEIFYEDIGEIEKIKIKHDNSGDGDSWLLEKVTVESHSGTYYFTSNNWVSWGRENVQPSIVIKEDSKRFKYAVKVKTSNKNNAGTRAGVFIQLYGKDNKTSSFQKIGYDIHDFDKGAENTFFVYVDNDIGDIHRIGLRHDNYVDGADWHIENITINNSTHFDINEWIGKNTNKEHPHKFFTNNALRRVDYTPGEKDDSSLTSRIEQWNIEVDSNLGETLGDERYRNQFRAPYIQNVTTNSAIVTWRTICPSDSIAENKYAKVILTNISTKEEKIYLLDRNHSDIDTNDIKITYPSKEPTDIFDDDGLEHEYDRANLEYKVAFKNLEPNTLYTYNIETSGEGKNTNCKKLILAENITFKTAPIDEYKDGIKFIAMGDFGIGNDEPSYMYDVFDLMHSVVRKEGIDFWLPLGDIINYHEGNPNAYDPFFFSVFNAYMKETPSKSSSFIVNERGVKAFRKPPYYGIMGGMPAYPTFGNHDLEACSGASDPSYEDSFKYLKDAYLSSFKFLTMFPVKSADTDWQGRADTFNDCGNGLYYTYRYGNAIFVSLAEPGENFIEKAYTSQSSAVKTYLEDIRSITENDDIWLIIYAHSPNVAKTYKDIFHECNVNLVLGGHHHLYDEKMLRTNSSDESDIFLITSGTGGFGGPVAPSRHPGFVSFEIKGNELYYKKYDTHHCAVDGRPIGGRDGIIYNSDKSSGDFAENIITEGSLTQKKKKLHHKGGICRVIVETGDRQGAGTDAKVEIKIHGSNQISDWTQLDNYNGRFYNNDYILEIPYICDTDFRIGDDFERNKVNAFTVFSGDMGDINKIEIKRDEHDLYDKWYLKEIFIEHAGKIYHFTVNSWIKPESSTWHEDKYMYKVIVKTGNKFGAGTDAHIKIKLFGTKNDSTWIKLDNLDDYYIFDGDDDFETGKTNTFILYLGEIDELGEIIKIQIHRDEHDVGDAWYLDNITIKHREKSYNFIANKWIVPNIAVDILEDSTKTFFVGVKTSNIPKAGTDANIFIKLIGNNNDESRWFKLDDPGKNDFVRDDYNSFVFPEQYMVKNLNKIQIQKDAHGDGHGWHVDYIDIEYKNKLYKFSINKWISTFPDIDTFTKE